ncbi:MAG: hypothetical protein EAZ76_01775 [Nostocales cyanobacterium]|nr:MAG: hypothetical protein EAZ87_00195 [Nostocales cyanobacterium]TAF20281.1 MAG: hypothetical protein EAZ76_01775 [Nostocales cyanobacterium]
MNNFNFKFFAISGVAIASALILFKTVTAYGENNLRATPLIDNIYHLQLNSNLPNCQKSNTLVLNIQQSGIYINGSISPIKTNDTNTPLNLTGKLNHQKLTLTGNINTDIFCQNPHIQKNQTQLIKIQMSPLNQNNISGQITINKIAQNIDFTALPQTDKKPTSRSQNH